MRPKPIWLFFISLLFSFASWAQTVSAPLPEENVSQQPDTLGVKEKKTYGLRFGLDLHRLIGFQFNRDFSGIELVGDLRLGKDLYVAAELGNENKTQQSEQIHFTTKGSYLKLGIDYNMFENWKGMDNQVYLGFRFANSFHSQEVNSYDLYTLNHFWDENETTAGFATGKADQLNAAWIEFVAGIKVALFKNLYVGFSLRLNRLLSDKKPDNFDNLYIPGFNRKTDENIFGAGFNYTLTYAIPIRF